MILITGPDGFVGTEVCRALLRRKHVVRGAQWAAGLLPEGCEAMLVGDINGETDWQAALGGVQTIVHLAARVHVMDDPAEDPLAAFSSIKANGESTDGRPFSEDAPPNPEDPYAMSKWEAEKLLREIESATDMGVTILRPPLLYGPAVKANFLKLIKLVAKGVPLPLGSIQNKRSLMGLGNFADLICHCVETPAAKGETFVASDGQDWSTAELARKIGAALDKKARVFSLNPGVLRVLAKITGKQNMVKRLTESLEIDSTKVRSVLAWSPPFSMEDELARTAKWFCDSYGGASSG